MPVGPLMPHARGKHGPRLALGIGGEDQHPHLSMLSPGNVPDMCGGFSWCSFSTLLHAPSAVHRDVPCLRTAQSEYIWKNAVAFLPNTLRAGTRRLFSFQGAVALFSPRRGRTGHVQAKARGA